MMAIVADLLVIVGAAAVVRGIAMWSISLAFIVGGGMAIAMGILVSGGVKEI